MDYLRGTVVLLCCCGAFFSLSDGQNVAEESPITPKINEGNRYTFRYGLADETYKDDIPRNKPFHDIFAIKSLSGETERVHYAVDDHGIRTNIHSNAVKFGPKIDTGAINFGSRFTGWPSDNFNSMFLSVPQVNVQNPPPHNNNEKVVPVPSLELPPAFVPLRTALSPAASQQLNLNPDINAKIQNPKKQVPSSVVPEPIQPFYPVELGYEPQRISRSFLPNPTYPTGNLPLAGHTTVDKDQNSALQNPVPFKTESEAISKEPRSLPSLPEFVPQLSNLNYIQHQYANNQNLKWYQSLPQVPPPPMHPMYSAPFYPVVNKYESQRNAKPSKSGFTSLKEELQNVPDPTDVPNVNVQTAAVPNFKESGIVRETGAMKSFPNVNEQSRSQQTSNSSGKSQDSIVIPESQNQKTNKNNQQYTGALRPSRLQAIFPGTFVPQPQKEEINLNNNKYMEYQKPSSLPLSNLDSASNFEPQREGMHSNINQYIRSQKPSSAPEQLTSTMPFASPNQLKNANQYALSDKISNPPVISVDSKFVSQRKSQDSLSNTNQFVGSQKPIHQTFKQQDTFSDQIKRNKPTVNKGINQYIGSQKPSSAPEQLTSTMPFASPNQLKNANQYALSDKISNLPVISVDSKFVSQPKFQDSLSNTNEFVGSQKTIHQTFKQQDTFSDQIKRNKPIVNKGIAPSFPKNFPKNILPSTKQPIVLTPTQNREQTVFNSKISPLFRKNAQFPLSKSLVSSPMSTIFDTSNDNGQYYHYVMNVGKKSGSIVPTRTMISTVNLFKLLNDTGIRKLNDNKKITGTVINLNDSKTINESQKPNLMFEKSERNTNKNFGSSSKSDLDVSGDVIDATEIFQDLPEITISDKSLEEKGNNQVSDNMIDEITNIINTEEPHPATERTNQDFDLVITTQPTTEQTVSSFLEDIFEINTTPKEFPAEYISMKSTTEQTTSSFLGGLFEINTTPQELPTEYTVRESTTSVSGGESTDQNTELASLFITLPENSLTSLFYEDDLEGNHVGLLKEKSSDESSLFDKDTTSADLNSEIKATTESRDSKEFTPTTAVSFDTSTITKTPVTATFAYTSSEGTSTESLSSETNKDLEDAMLSTTNLISSDLTSTENPDLSTLFKETLNGKSESNTEEPTSTIPSSSILVDVVNTGTTTNEEIVDLTDAPTANTEQPKPMLELVIQNTEMNDFMSRINNMPIMIRVLNPVTTTTQAPDVGREISTTEGNSNLNFNTIVSTSLNEMGDVSSTESTTLTSLNIDSKELNVTDISEEKTPASIVQTLSSVQSNTNADVEETLITEPNFEDTVILTSLKPQNSESTLSDTTDTETEMVSNATASVTTPIPKSTETGTAVLLDSQLPEALQFTLFRPGNYENPDSPLLSTTEFESFADYANKLASSAQNYNIGGTIEVHEDQSSGLAVSGEPYTAIPVTNADQPLSPMFFDSDQVHASEESQNIANFKSMNSVNNNREPKQSAIRPVNFQSPSQPIIIKNSTVIQYQDISNYKGYDRHAPVQYVDLVPFKDIDYDSHLQLGNEDKFPSDAIFVLDDYDVLPQNPDGQNNDYVFIGSNGNFESNILPSNVLSPTDFDAQPVYVLDSNTPKFGARFQQETLEDQSQQEKLSDSQQPEPLNFENFRPQRSFESKNDFRKEPWFSSQ